MKVLIVDDFEVNIRLVSHYLTQLGIVSDVAYNGIEALEKISKNNYYFVLLDIQMPFMDGFETAYTIREKMKIDKNTLPLIMMTASISNINLLDKYGHFFNKVLEKPVDKIDLKKIVDEHIVVQL